MSIDHASLLAEAKRSYLIAPAGCGKTHLIAQAVAQYGEGVQLVLTHTHAGVHALREKLRKLGASPQSFRVFTIAGWAFHCARCYPSLSGLSVEFYPAGNAWNEVYEAAIRFLNRRVAKEVLAASYSGVYVDEYQDCTQNHHQIVLALAEILPCRILGDPLQGIFNFRRDPVVDWNSEIAPHFELLPELETPWRWLKDGCNQNLGEWLTQVRQDLLNGSPIDLRSSSGVVKWYPNDHVNKVNIPRSIAQKNHGTITAICRLRHEADTLAKQVNTHYTSIEEMDCQKLLDWCGKFEDTTGPDRAIKVIEFAEQCMVDVPKHFGTAKKAFSKQRTPSANKEERQTAIDALILVERTTDMSPILPALKAISRAVKRRPYMHELWSEMARTLQEYQGKDYSSLKDAAQVIRNRTRQQGRKLERYTASTTLLLKGLEFDHVVVLNADNMNAKHLYVALTRGAKSLTILSSSQILNPSTSE